MWIIVYTVLIFNFFCLSLTSPKFANISGDVVIGGLVPVHFASGEDQCGKIQLQDGIQFLEAMAYSVQQINREKVLPGFTLGMIAMDTCASDTIALENSLEFVKSKMNDVNIPVQQDGLICHDGTLPFSINNVTDSSHERLKQVIGVIGPVHSKVSIQVASFLRLFKLPQISYASTSPELSNRDRFSYFKRTVPSDIYLGRAVVEILRKLEWQYVSCIYEDNSYGINLFTELEKLSSEAGICFGYVEKLQFTEGDTEAIENAVNKLLDKRNKNGKVVVALFVRFSLSMKIFKATHRLKAQKKIIWVGTDTWSGRTFDDTDIQDVVQGSITVQPLARKLAGFDEYFTGLNMEKNKWNPWFGEFWESFFNCRFPSKDQEEEKEAKTIICDQSNKISKDNGYKQLPLLYFVADAVNAFVYALKNIHQDFCGDKPGLCRNMSSVIVKGQVLLKYLNDVNFIDALGYNFTFLNGTDGPARYSILTYAKTADEYDWKEIGTFIGTEHQFKIKIDPDAKLDHIESSVCSLPCNKGQYRSVNTNNKCCWNCRDCRENQYLSSDFLCEDCPLGHLPNNFRNGCYPVPVEKLTFHSPWSISAYVVSAVGIILCIFVSIVYFLKRDTPMIKASGMELSLVLLAGILLSYVSLLIFVAPPSTFTCGATRFLLGTCYTLCYAAVAIKTNRIYRIFDGSSPKKKRFTGWKSSLVITFFITAVEIVFILTWLISNPPEAIIVHPSYTESVLVCSDATDFSYLLVLVYPFLVMLVCLFFAIRTRKTPDGFNETSQIAFCTYSTVILWIAFIPVYFVTKNNTIRIMSLCFSMSVSATVYLVLLFLTKIYIVLFSPEQNTKECVMTRSSQRNSTATDMGIRTGSRTASTFTLNLNGSSSNPRMSTQPQFSTMSTMSTLSITDIDIGLRNLRAERQCSTDSGPFNPGSGFTSEASSLSRSLPNLVEQNYHSSSISKMQTSVNYLESVPEMITEGVSSPCDDHVKSEITEHCKCNGYVNSDITKHCKCNDCVQGDIAEHDTCNNDVVGDIAKHNTCIDDVVGGIAEHNTCIDDVDGGIAEHNTCIDDVVGGIAEHDTFNDNVVGGIAEHNTCIDDVVGGIAEHNTCIDDVDGGIAEHNTCIDDVVGGIAEHDAFNDNVVGGIAEHNPCIDDVVGDIAGNDTCNDHVNFEISHHM